MKPTTCWGALALTLTPFGAWALGLGDIELSSALNQPLEAEIELVSATDDELTTLRIELASFETFERYGLDRPAFLDGISFQINVDDFGNAAVAVSSQQPIAEPFVTILVEASWARGRLLREYTVLLDPPVLLPVPEVAANVQPAQTGGAAPAEPAAAINRPAATTITPATTPVLETLEPVETAAAPTPAPLGGSYGPVQSAETLWSIAAQSRPAGVTMNQMMVAIYEANPQSFSGNMNTLHQGATLRIPQSDELAVISAAAATQEAIRQAALWEGGTEDSARLRLVTPESTEDAAVTGGGTDTAVAAATDDVASAAVADLEGEVESLRGELENNQRLLEIRDQQLQDLQAQLAVAEALEASAESDAAAGADAPVEAAGVDLESEPLFADEQPAETAPVEEQTPAVVTPAATTNVVTTPAEPSLISTLLGFLLSPILLIALGLIALTGTAVWYLRYRQQDADDVTGRWEALEADIGEDEDADASSSIVVAEGADAAEAADGDGEDDFAIDAPTASEPEAEQDIDASLDLESGLVAETEASDDSTPSAPTMTIGVPPSEPAHNETISSQTVINLEQADPVAEADFHMAYGLYDQAAELVEKALEAEPGRRDLTLKLLEVFFVWGNKESFLEAAQVLHSEIGTNSDSDWDKVVIMDKQICPDEALFSAAPAAAGSVDVDLDAGESPALDLAFDADDDADDDTGVDLNLGDMDAPHVDLELEASGSQAVVDESVADDELDVGDQTAAGLEAALFEQSASDDDATLTDADVEIDFGAAAGEDTEVGLDDDADDASDLLADSALTENQAIEGELGNIDETFTDEDADSLAATQESPTVESPITPTAEETGADEDAVDSPTVESALEGTGELPTIEQPRVVEDSRDPADRTAEIDLDDLGLDVDELSDLTNDLSVLADDSPSAIADGELSSADVTDVLESEEAAEAVADQDETLLASDIEDETPLAIGDKDATMEAPGRPDADDSALADQDATLLAPDSLDSESSDFGDQDETLLAPSASDSSISDLGDQDATMLAPGYDGSASDGATNMLQPSAEDLGVDASITEVLEGGSPSAEDTLSEPGPAAGEELVSDTLEQEALPSADASITEILEGSEDIAAAAEFNTELEGALAGQNADDAATVEASSVEAESGIDLNLDEVASALEGSDTVEQPVAQSVGSDVFPEPTESTHLDIGSQTSLGDETMSGQSGLLDPHTMTMTEVGTKLDLARAYVDMGDPDGARSILDEVLEEGDEDQQTEANKIIKDL